MTDDLPSGYRQGVISAITVLLGFSLLFMRYWTFEAPGTWTRPALAALVLLAASILVQFWALWRSLQLKDNTRTEYAVTLRVFMASVLLLIGSVAVAGLVEAGIVGHAPAPVTP
jgi:hypothetical protein